MISLDIAIEKVSRINGRIIPALKRLGIKTIRDLLFYLPNRYEDFSNVKKIKDLNLSETVTIRGEIKKIANRRTAKKHLFLTEALVGDDTGNFKVLWFNQPFLLRNFRPGQIVNLSGKIVLGSGGLYLQNPAYEKITNYELSMTNLQGTHTGGLVAVYPETEGISSRWLRFLIKSFIDQRKYLIDPLPAEIRQRNDLPEIKKAVLNIHFPKILVEAEQAKKRFDFESLLLIQLRALRERMRLNKNSAFKISLDLSLIKKFVSSLPYQLTDAQRRSLWEILQDLAQTRPMNRLLEGDVGSGKTVVAAAAALATVKSGLRVAFMAPTEILANQHFQTLEQTLSPFSVKIGLFTGSNKKIKYDPQIIVGTHALIHPVRSQTLKASVDSPANRISNGVQKKPRLDNLGLVVIDEQHRFGVEQRAALVQSNKSGIENYGILPHFLSMTATPIPRTLALTIYGDLDLSILDEMPKTRKPVVTKIIEPEKRNEAYQFIREEVGKGRQAFVICPRIEICFNHKQQKPSYAEVKTVKEEYKKLSEEIFPDLQVRMLHGKLKSKDKEMVMASFRSSKIDILVSTSVVEVGVDIPNATIMMIEGAERFGLAQLHQFRGRVGRGADQAYCFLFPSEDGFAAQRLRAVVESKNGFELAEKDLKVRGPGDILGTRQWGISNNLLRALADASLVRSVRTEAIQLLKQDPELKNRKPLLELLKKMEHVHLE